MKPAEYVSEDILNENLIQCFGPIHMLQYVLGSLHADIRDCFMTPLSLCQKFYTGWWIFMMTLCVINLEYFYITAYYDKNIILCFSLVLGAIIQYLAYVCNISHARFFKGNQSIQIYMMLHKIDRLLRLHDLKPLYEKQYYFNCVIVPLITICFLTGYMVHAFYCVDNPGLLIISGVGLLVIYMEVLLTGSLIYYLGLRLKVFNELVRYNIILKKENNIPGVDRSWVLKETYRIIRDSGKMLNRYSLTLKEFMISIKLLLRTYYLITQRFRFTVLTIVCTLFCWTFVLIETLVVGLQTELFPLIGIITMICWLMFYFLILTCLAITSDWFIKHINETRSMCIYTLSRYYEGSIFRAAKDLVRLIELERPVFSIYGIFALNRGLPLELIGVITGYVVILLQFTL